jgi:hypothetical protein
MLGDPRICASPAHCLLGGYAGQAASGIMRGMADDLDLLEQQYEDAESAFLAAVRGQSARGELAAAALAVARAAGLWNAEAYRVFYMSTGSPRENLDALTERTEVLSELWVDMAEAFDA